MNPCCRLGDSAEPLLSHQRADPHTDEPLLSLQHADPRALISSARTDRQSSSFSRGRVSSGISRAPADQREDVELVDLHGL